MTKVTSYFIQPFASALTIALPIISKKPGKENDNRIESGKVGSNWKSNEFCVLRNLSLGTND